MGRPKKARKGQKQSAPVGEIKEVAGRPARLELEKEDPEREAGADGDQRVDHEEESAADEPHGDQILGLEAEDEDRPVERPRAGPPERRVMFHTAGSAASVEKPNRKIGENRSCWLNGR